MGEEWQNLRVNGTKGVDKEWKVFREAVLAYAREVFNIWKVGGRHVGKSIE